MDWPANAHDWPLATFSRFQLCKPHLWHIQEDGTGPTVLLIHGAGGGTQSWRHLFPLLAKSYRVVAIDLPGQGFTKLGAQQRCSLPAMTEDIVALCDAEGWEPTALIGHSAGAAIALQMTQIMTRPEMKIVGINAALSNFEGLAGVLFPIIAKALASVPMVADIFSTSATRGNTVEKLIAGTGSTLTQQETEFYRRLISDRTHVSATLQMMSQWALDDLLKALNHIKNETHLIVGDKDMTVPPSVSASAANAMPHASCDVLAGLGHLAHEEDAARVDQVIQTFLSR